MSVTIIEKYLNKVGLLNDMNRALVYNASDIDFLPHILSILFRTNTFSQDNFVIAVKYENKFSLFNLLRTIEKKHLLTHEIFHAVTNYENFIAIEKLIEILEISNLLNQDNFLLALQQHSLSGLMGGLNCLIGRNLLTQENFNSLLNPMHAKLISEDTNEMFWRALGNAGELTQVNFNRLLIVARQQNPFENLIRLTNEILSLDDAFERVAIFRP